MFPMLLLAACAGKVNQQKVDAITICESHGYVRGSDLYSDCLESNRDYVDRVNAGGSPVVPSGNKVPVIDPGLAIGTGAILLNNGRTPPMRTFNCSTSYSDVGAHTTCY